jgi:hypothetical protein
MSTGALDAGSFHVLASCDSEQSPPKKFKGKKISVHLHPQKAVVPRLRHKLDDDVAVVEHALPGCTTQGAVEGIWRRGSE